MSAEEAVTTGGEASPEPPPRALARLFSGHPAETRVAIFSLAVVALCCLTYSPWIAPYASRLASCNKVLAVVDGLLDPFRNPHVLLGSGLPVYVLKIQPRQYAILQQAAEEANKNGWLNDDLKSWANATFIDEGRSYDVQVRIRGDLRAHWSGPKKSYRIKFGKQTITDAHGTREEPIYFQGKREMNLIIPSDRLYALAPWMSNLMREAGLVAPRDRFVILKINGVLHGLYYEVEHFDHPLLAAARRPETTIFGQSNRAMHYEHFTKLGRPGPTDAGYDLGSLRRQVDLDGDLGLRAMQVLIDHSLHPTPENFRRVRAILDWDKYLRYRAVTAICNTNHDRFGTDNLKFFFDASRGLLEPVQWDVKLIKMPKEPGTIDFDSDRGTDEIQRATLLDPELRLQRNRLIWQLVGDGGDSLMAKYDAIHNRIRTLVWADVLVAPIQGHKMEEIRKTLEFNIHRVYKVLEYSSANVTFRLLASDRASVDVACLNYSGIRLYGIELADSLQLAGTYRLYEDADEDGELGPHDPLVAQAVASDGKARFDLDRRVFPEVKYGSNLIDGTHWEFFDALMGRRRFFVTGRLAAADRGPLEFRAPKVRVAAVNAVTERPIPPAILDPSQSVPNNTIGVLAYDASDPWDLEAEQASFAVFLERHPEFRPCRKRPGAAELAGRVVLAGTAIVPRSVPLVIGPGADITLRPGASVLCYGGLSAIGTSGAPIRIHGDGSGKPWNTFAVVRPPEKVVVIHTHFRDGGQAQINGILFTGGFAVHNGDLELRHCTFTDMRSEDSINLKNGRIAMTDCLVRRSASDGLDLDFVRGEVSANQFEDIGGDAVDLSGSTILVAGNRCERVADKGISVGEDSHPTLVNDLLQGCSIGVSTKDLSFARVEHCTFVGNRLAIEAKRKKAMFGGGSADVAHCVFARNAVLLEEDYFSRGKVQVKLFIADTTTRWSTCKTVAIRFVAPEQGDYRLAPSLLDGLGVGSGPQGWGHAAGGGSGVSPDETPGILSGGHGLGPAAEQRGPQAPFRRSRERGSPSVRSR